MAATGDIILHEISWAAGEREVNVSENTTFMNGSHPIVSGRV